MSNDTQDLIDAVEKLAEAADTYVHYDYSGRGMYGATCAAVYTTDRYTAIELAVTFKLPRPKLDQMGKGWVAYWPSIT